MNNRFKDYEPEGQQLMAKFEEALKSASLVYFDVDDLESIIDIYIDIEDIDSARRAFNYSMRVHPGSDDLKCKEAKILLLEGHYLKAIRILSGYEKLRPDYLGILAECNLRMRYYHKSKKIFDQYLMSCEKEDLEPILYDIASLFNTYERYDYSIYYLETAVTLFPESVSLRIERAYTYDHLHRYTEAIADFKLLIDKDPYSADLWSMMASSCFSNTNYSEALRAYEYAIAINPDNINYISFKGHCLFYLDRFEESIEAYKEYLKQDPNNQFINTFIGQAYENTDQFDNAIKHYNIAIKGGTDLEEAWMGLAECYLNLGDYESAYSTIDKAKKLFPRNPKVFYNKGIIEIHMYEESGDKLYIAEAFDDFLTCFDFDRSNYECAFKIGTCCLQLGEFDGAVKSLEYAYERDQDLPQITLYLAIAYYGEKDYMHSMEFLKKAKETISNAESIFLSIFPEAEKEIRNNK